MNIDSDKIQTYTETAYDSTRPREFPRPRVHGERIARRRHPITGRGKRCGEYLAVSHAEAYLPQLKRLSQSAIHKLEQEQLGDGIYKEWQSLKNPAAVVQQLKAFIGFWTLTGGLLGSLTLLFLSGLNLESVRAVGLAFVLPAALYGVLKIALSKGFIKNKNNTILNRCTGKVSFTYNKRRRSIPFDEFDPYLSIATNPTGSSNYYLRLVHRYSSRSVVQPDSYNTPWEAEVGWELLQQFMDVSQPLPDVPGWELTRRYDPTSIEYDQRHGRPPDYWKDRDIEQVRKWVDASRKAAEAFPWGSTREQALAMGWQPSGVGEGDWLDRRHEPVPAPAAGSQANA